MPVKLMEDSPGQMSTAQVPRCTGGAERAAHSQSDYTAWEPWKWLDQTGTGSGFGALFL